MNACTHFLTLKPNLCEQIMSACFKGVITHCRGSDFVKN